MVIDGVKTIRTNSVTKAVQDLCIKANYHLPADIEHAVCQSRKDETWSSAKAILGDIEENISVSAKEGLPLCQDTGMAVVFLRLGQDVHIEGGLLEDAINEGVRQGYREGFLRNSVVADPLRRSNTGDNTPALVTVQVVAGNGLEITVAPKGFGSENMSRIKMCRPSDGRQGVVDFVLETVRLAGGNPCPPIVVGVGIGGSFDKVALLAKQALLRPIDKEHPDDFYAELERQLLQDINKLGIGPQGFGGKTTALGVNIEVMPTHIAGLPVAVNISCHVTRHATVLL